MIATKTALLAAIALATSSPPGARETVDPRPNLDAPPGAANRQARRAAKSNRP